MKNRPDILEVLSRTQTGEYCSNKEWDTKRIPAAVRDALKRHGLAGTCDVDDPINSDPELADRFFVAARELALDLGYLCADTERIVSVSAEELDNAIKAAPSEITLGYGKDARVMKSRTPGDPYPVMVCASLAITMSEDVYPVVTEAIAREPEVDILGGGSLVTWRGHEILSGTPFETLLGYEQSVLHREIRRRAGRPGMPGNGVYSAVTEYGQFGGYGAPGGFTTTDLALVLFPSELKIDYRSLQKVVHMHNHGGLMRCDAYGMIGGMPGPPEGAVLTSVACALLSYAILGNDAGGGQIYDVRYLANVNREGLWGASMTQQVLSRNTHLLCHGIANSVSGTGDRSTALRDRRRRRRPCIQRIIPHHRAEVGRRQAQRPHHAAGVPVRRRGRPCRIRTRTGPGERDRQRAAPSLRGLDQDAGSRASGPGALRHGHDDADRRVGGDLSESEAGSDRPGHPDGHVLKRDDDPRRGTA